MSPEVEGNQRLQEKIDFKNFDFVTGRVSRKDFGLLYVHHRQKDAEHRGNIWVTAFPKYYRIWDHIGLIGGYWALFNT